MTTPTNDEDFRDWLSNVIYVATEEVSGGAAPRLESFAEAGILTSNEGVVLSFPTGDDFCLTIQRWR